MIDQTTDIVGRKQISDNIRAIRRNVSDPDYARALCRAILVNFHTGPAVVPRQSNSRWYPRRRG
jgi:hypothetical protein